MTCLFLSNVILLYSAIKRKLFWEKGEANVRSHGKKSRVFKASEEHFQCFLSQIWIKLQSFLSVQRTKKYDEVKYCSVMIFGERPRRLNPPPPQSVLRIHWCKTFSPKATSKWHVCMRMKCSFKTHWTKDWFKTLRVLFLFQLLYTVPKKISIRRVLINNKLGPILV